MYIDLRKKVAEESDAFAKRLFASAEMTTAIVSIVKVVRTNARADKRAADEMQATDTLQMHAASQGGGGASGGEEEQVISLSTFTALIRQHWVRRMRFMRSSCLPEETSKSKEAKNV